MKEITYTVKDENGIHARPAGLLVKQAKAFASKVTVLNGGKSCDMKKIMALMAMGIKQNDTITVQVEGEDEEACAKAVGAFLAENF